MHRLISIILNYIFALELFHPDLGSHNPLPIKKRQPKNATSPVLRKPEDHETDSVGIGITTIKEYYEFLEQQKQKQG